MRYGMVIAGAMAACTIGGAGFADVNPAPSASQAGPFAATCAKVTCRSAAHVIQLRTAEGGTMNVTAAASPYVNEDGVLSIYAGEAIEISFDRSDLGHPKFVRALAHVDSEGVKGYQPNAAPPDPSTPATLSLELRQEEGKAGMTLLLRNDTGVPLKYEVTMVVPTPEGMKKAHTSTCPLFPGMMGDESWPHPVALLLISNFHTVETGQFTCE